MKRSFDNRVSFIVATKDRPDEICRMLRSIETGTRLPDEIIIVDGGTKTVEFVKEKFVRLNIRYLRCTPPSSTKQRNMGIRAIGQNMSLVGFFDDDIVLEPEALGRMMSFWDKAEDWIGGAAFNMINHPKMEASIFKKMGVVERLGLYSRRPGVVMPSGFQTMIGWVDKSVLVQWLPSGASIFRKRVFSEFEFDEWFSGYSYLEDLDFSFRVGKKYTLVVVADAGYHHYPGPRGRGNGFEFGMREVLNRVHFVIKNKEFSLLKCIIGICVRFLISIEEAVTSFETYQWQRALGNLSGLKSLLFGGAFREVE